MAKTIKTKRIGIDARFYGPTGKGLGRYIQEIVDRVTSLDDKNEYVIFLRPENFSEYHQTNDKKIKKIAINIKWYSWSEQLLFPFYIWREKVDLMHFPHFNVPILCPVKFVVTIHDLILTKFPTIRASALNPIVYKFKNWCYQLVINIAVRRAKLIISVSEFTKKDILNKFKININKIIVTYEGVSNLLNPQWGVKKNNNDKKNNLGYNIKKPYILYVGNTYPHKNIEKLIDSYLLLVKIKSELQLVLVGADDFFYKRIKKYAADLNLYNEKTKSKIIFLGFVSDEELKRIYANAEAYIFPSLYEGFGLPPLEAMANGCPVISSNQASMPEILEEAAIYFDPRNIQDMTEKIHQVLENKQLKRELIKLGYKQIQKYDWQKCAVDTLAIYSSIIN